MTFVLGLTGSIGMGKSTVARQFALLGARVSDADAIVHRLLAPGGAAFAAVAKHFPAALRDGWIDRRELGRQVFGQPEKLAKLESILHPLVRVEHRRAIRQAARRRLPLLVLEIPLLYETGAEALCDAVAVVSAPAWLQRRRVMARPGMTEQKFRSIRAAQMPDAEKRRRADYVIPTGLGKAVSFHVVRRIAARIRAEDVRYPER